MEELPNIILPPDYIEEISEMIESMMGERANSYYKKNNA